MVVRIRFSSGRRVDRRGRKNQRLALAFSALLTPAALMSTALGVWRVAADLKWTGAFAISNGFFSHWQVWIAGGGLLQLASHLLSRYGRGRAQAAAASSTSA
jgi:hypothetical protein